MPQEVFDADIKGFEQVYRRHVGLVVNQDMDGVLADMAPGSVPQVFAGVKTPRGPVQGGDIRRVTLEGKRAIGECVYLSSNGVIGLRSGWAHDGVTWKADALENFAP